MKKLIALFLSLLMLFTLVACSNTDTNSEDSKNEKSKTEESKTSSENIESVDWSSVESALDILDKLKPEGWDENRYGAYIYDKYDSDVLPDCFPDQIEGTLAYMTKFKDYDHDVINQNYRVGNIYYENASDYSEYSVSFYAKAEHLKAFIDALESKGMVGYMEGEDEAFGTGSWCEGFYGNGEWAISLFFNTNDNKNGKYDGCVTVSATNDLYDLPESIAGIPLPKKGIVTDNFNKGYTIHDFTNGYDDIDFDMKNDSFPKEYFAAWVDYYCVSRQDAVDYVGVLENNGWTVEYNYSDEEDDYSKVLKKGDVFAIVDYENTYMNIGFSDMIENLTY